MLIDAACITEALRGLGVEHGDTLFVHSGLQGSGRVAGARSRDKLDTIVAGLTGAVGDAGTLVLPTFTYSLCWGQEFDVDESRSTVGQLTEHFRRLPGVRRTCDPIFSAAVLGPVDAAFEQPLFTLGDKDCFGEESIFAQLLARDGKLLFYDVGFGFCTFVHHVEQAAGVPYRYRKRFSGRMRAAGEQREVSALFNVRRLDENVDPHFDALAAVLAERGQLRRATLPDGPTLLVVAARAVAAAVREGLAVSPDYLVRRGYGLPPLEELAA